MQITLAHVEDRLALAKVHIDSWQSAYVGLFPPEYLASLSILERAEAWRGVLAAGESRTFVARRAGAVVGFISFGRCRDVGAPPTRGEVWALYLAPDAWSTGAGRALWEVARVQMNPPRLEDAPLFGGLAIGGFALVIGIVVLNRRFGRVQRGEP